MTALFYASLAVWITCFGLSLLHALVGGVLELSRGLEFPAATLTVICLIAVFAAPVVLAVTFIVGFPALLLLEHFKLTMFWHWAAFGAGLGALLALCHAIFSAVAFNYGIGLEAVTLIVLGAVAASTAWASLWLDRRRDVLKEV